MVYPVFAARDGLLKSMVIREEYVFGSLNVNISSPPDVASILTYWILEVEELKTRERWVQ
jgi:hypothetical protein